MSNQKLFRFILLPTAGLLALFLIAGIGFQPLLNSALASQQFRQWLTAQIETQSSGTFSYEGISGNPFLVTLTSVSFQNNPQANIRSAKADKLDATFDLLSFAQGRLKLNALTLHKAQATVSLSQSSTEAIALPLGVSSISLRESEISVAQFAGWTVQMSNASVDLHQTKPDNTEIRNLHAATAKLKNIQLESIKAHADMNAKGLVIQSLSAQLSGGQLDLSGSLTMDGTHKIDNANLTLKQAQLQPLLSMVAFSTTINGTLTEANANDISGNLSPKRTDLSASGSATFSGVSTPLALPDMAKGMFPNLQPVQNISGSTSFRFVSNSIELPDLTLQHPDGKFELKGKVGLDTSLSMEGNLFASEKMVSGVPVKSGFKKTDDGTYIVPFKLSGSTKQIKVDASQAFLNSLNPVNLIQSIFD